MWNHVHRNKQAGATGGQGVYHGLQWERPAARQIPGYLTLEGAVQREIVKIPQLDSFV